MKQEGTISQRDRPFFVVWWFDCPSLGFGFVARFPAKMVLKGNLVLSADVFPRQGGFGGFSECDFQLIFPAKGFLAGYFKLGIQFPNNPLRPITHDSPTAAYTREKQNRCRKSRSHNNRSGFTLPENRFASIATAMRCARRMLPDSNGMV